MSIATLELYERIRSKISEEDAKFYFETFQNLEKSIQEEINMNVDRKFEHVATKLDLSETEKRLALATEKVRSEIIKWMFIFWLGSVGLASLIHYWK